MFRPLAFLADIDRLLFDRLTRRERPLTDRFFTRLSDSANRSMLWLAIAGLLAFFGARSGRRAAIRGVVSIALTSTLVNLPLKYLARRQRPVSRSSDRPLPINLPNTFSFPSGHSASAFAFAIGVGLEEPWLLVPILPLAASVAYSRIRLRVHYPFDVLVGAAIGTGMGIAGGVLTRFARQRWDPEPPALEMESVGTNRLILVASPHAGQEYKLGRAKRLMTARGLEIMAEIAVDDLHRLGELVRNNGSPPPIVVAAGGDGTVGAVANALMETPTVLGILPLGTSNDFARSINIPIDIYDAVQVIAGGQFSRHDVGRVTRDGHPPRHFVHAAAAGMNVQFARFATRADLRERFGRLTYAVAMAIAMRHPLIFSCEAEAEGRMQRLSLVHLAVINAPIFGGFLDLKLPGANLDDRTLDVIMIEHLPIRCVLRSALYPIFGVRRPIRGIRTLQVSSLRANSQQPMDLTVDGEIDGGLPATFEIVPAALGVLTPVGRHDLLARR